MTRPITESGALTPAFPNAGNHTWNMPPDAGMSLRDWVAGKCLAAAFGGGDNEALWVAKGETKDEALRRHWFGAAKAAFAAADAFLAARATPTEDHSDG